MKILSIILCLAFVAHVRTQTEKLRCKKCDKKAKSSCTEDQTCSHLQTRCVSVHWTAGHPTIPNKYTMRCATADECSDRGLKQLCNGDDKHCEAKSCAYANCDPYYVPRFVQTAGRSHRCYQCNSESLDSCEESVQTCDDDQDACLSLLMEGGNSIKVYTKRCARKDECSADEQKRLCDEETEESLRKTCRSSCCYEQLCNTASTAIIATHFASICFFFTVLFLA